MQENQNEFGHVIRTMPITQEEYYGVGSSENDATSQSKTQSLFHRRQNESSLKTADLNRSRETARRNTDADSITSPQPRSHWSVLQESATNAKVEDLRERKFADFHLMAETFRRWIAFTAESKVENEQNAEHLRRGLHDVSQIHEKNLLFYAFSKWSDGVWECKMERQQSVQAVEHWAYTTIRSTFHAWREFVIERRPSSVSHPVQVRCLAKWIKLTLPRKNSNDPSFGIRRPIAMKNCAPEDSDSDTGASDIIRKQHEERFQRRIQALRENVLRGILERIAPTGKNIPLLLHGSAIADAWTVHQVFVSWRAHTENIRKFKLKLKRKHFTDCISKWLHFSDEKQRLHELVRQVNRVSLKCRARTAVKLWKSFQERESYFKYKLGIARHEQTRRCMRNVFLCWRRFCEKSSKLNHAERSFHIFKQGRYIMTWKRNAHKSRQLRTNFQFVSCSRHRDELHDLFALWKRMAIFSSLVRQHRRKTLLGRSFGAWYFYSRETRSDRILCGKADEFYVCKTLLKSFSEWKKFAQQTKAIERFDLRRKKRLEKDALELLVSNVGKQKVDDASIVDTFSNLRRSILFQEWRKVLVVHQMSLRSASRAYQEYIASAFYSWRACTRDAIQMRGRIASCSRELLRKKQLTFLNRWARLVRLTKIMNHFLQRWTHTKELHAVNRWRSYRKARQNNRTIIASATRKIAFVAGWRALNRWIEVTRTRHDRRKKAQTVATVFRNSQLTRSLRSWMIFTKSSYARKERLNTARRFQARWALRRWHQWVARRHRAVDTIRNVVNRLQNSTISRTFNSWRCYVQHNKRNELTLAESREKFEKYKLAAFLNKWCLLSCKTVKKRRLMMRIARHFMDSRAFMALRRWKETTYKRKEARSIVSSVINRLSNVKVSFALRSWMQWSSKRKCARIKIKSVVLRIQHQKLATAWESWAEYKVQRVKWKSAIAEKRARLLEFKVFASVKKWSEIARKKKRAHKILATACNHIGNCRLYHTFSIWSLFVKEKQYHESRILEGQEAFVFWKMDRAIIHWYHCWARKQAWVITEDQFSVEWENLRMSKAIRLWKGMCERRGRKRQLVERACGYFTLSGAAKATKRWRYWTQIRIRNRTLIEKSTRAWRYKYESYAVSRWIQWRKARIHNRQALDKCIAMFQHSRQHKALRTWYSHCKMRQHSRSTLEHTVKRWQNSKIYASLVRWKQFLDERHRYRALLKSVVNKMSKVTLWTAWRGWRSFIFERKRKRSILAHAAGKFMNVEAAKLVNRWVEWARLRRNNRLLLMRSIHTFSRLKQMKAIRTWVQNAKRRQTTREVIGKVVWRLRNLQSYRAIRRWYFVSQKRKDNRRLITIAGRFWRSTVVGSAFVAWKQNANELIWERKASFAAERIHRYHMLRSGFQCLRKYRKLNCAYRRVNERALKNSVSTFFFLWRFRAVGIANHRWRSQTFLNKVSQSIESVQMSQVFCIMKQFYIKQKRSKMKGNVLKDIIDRSVRRNIFIGWSQAMRANSWNRYRLLRSTFSLWISTHHEWVSERLAVERFQTRVERQPVQITVLELGSVQDGVSACLKRWMHPTLTSVWNQWRQFVRDQHISRELNERAARHAVFNILFQRLYLWRENVEYSVQWRKATHHFETNLLQKVICSWSRYTQFSRERRHYYKALMDAASRHYCCSLMEKVFHSWNLWVVNRMYIRQKLERFVGNQQFRQLSEAFSSWKTFKHLQILNKQLLFNLQERVETRRLGDALAAWRDHVRMIKSNRQYSERMYESHVHSLRNRMFQTWARNSKLLIAYRDGCSLIEKVHDNIMQAKVFHVLTDFNNRKQSWRKKVVVLNHRLGLLYKSKCLQQWRKMYADKARMYAKEDTLRLRHCTRKLWNTLLLWQDKVKSLQKSRNMLQNAIKQGIQIRKNVYFCKWKETYLYDKGINSKYVLLLEAREKKILQRHFDWWNIVLHHWKESSERRQKADSFFKMKHFRIAVAKWAQKTREERKLRHQEYAVESRILKRRAATTIGKWYCHLRERILQRRRMDAAVNHFSVKSTWRAIHCWKRRVTFARRRRQAMQAASAHYEHSLLIRSFSYLAVHTVIVQQEREERNGEIACGHYKTTLADKIFLAWSSYSKKVREIREKEYFLEDYLRTRALTRTLSEWQLQVQMRKVNRSKWQVAMDHVKTKVVKPAFIRWRSFAEKSLQLRKSATETKNLVINLRQRNAMKFWRSHAYRVRQNEEKVERFKNGRERSVCAFVLSALRHNKTHNKSVRNAFRECLRLRREKKISSCLRVWSRASHMLRYNRLLSSFATEHYQAQFLSKHFREWCWVTSSIRENRDNNTKSVIHYRHTLLSKTLQKWSSYYYNAVYERRKLHYARSRMVYSLLERHIFHWRSYVCSVKELRESIRLKQEKRIQVERRLSIERRRNLGSTFHVWAENAKLARKLRRHERNLNAFIPLRNILSSWRSYTANAKFLDDRISVLHVISEQFQMSRALRLWKLFTSRNSQLQNLSRQCEEYCVRMKLHRTIRLWKQNAVRKAELRSIGSSTAFKVENRTKRKAIIVWCRYAVKSVSTKFAVRTLQQRRLRGALRCWKRNVHAEKLDRLQDIKRQYTLIQALGRWNDTVVSLKRLRKNYHYLHNECEFRKRRRIFFVWHREYLVRSHRRRYLRVEYFTRWKKRTKDLKSSRDANMDILHKRIQIRTTRQILRRWAYVAKRSSSSKATGIRILEELAYRLKMQKRQIAFKKLKKYYVDKQKKQLQILETQRQILLRQFVKRWSITARNGAMDRFKEERASRHCDKRRCRDMLWAWYRVCLPLKRPKREQRMREPSLGDPRRSMQQQNLRTPQTPEQSLGDEESFSRTIWQSTANSLSLTGRAHLDREFLPADVYEDWNPDQSIGNLTASISKISPTRRASSKLNSSLQSHGYDNSLASALGVPKINFASPTSGPPVSSTRNLTPDRGASNVDSFASAVMQEFLDGSS